MNQRTKILVVTAGGSGTRMGADIPKQFLTLGGKAILQMTIERFLEADPSTSIVTVLPEAHIGYWKSYCYDHPFICPQKLVKGGFTRFHSVRNALAKIPDGALVAVHDGVRPLITPDKINELFALAQTCPAVIPVTPVTDTLKVLNATKLPDGTIEYHPIPDASVDRSVIFGAQTPQIFHSELLKEAYAQPFDPMFTDDASVAAKKGMPLTYVSGERLNIKITTPEDLLLAKAILTI
ncbi:MAG: 2-C-methyl-D-erythritol 4-phosphate cytidylyltransferase [Candidatus Cryptobacteroides sp.]